MTYKLLIGAAVLALTPVTAHAATLVSVGTSAGTIYNTPAISKFATTSADMVGSVVKVNFANGSSNSAIWTAAGAFTLGQWALTVSGGTYNNPWVFSNLGSSTITGFSFDGVPGNTTFDIVAAPVIDSPSSSYGRPFSDVVGPANLRVSALYTNELKVGGTFYGDEYTKLIVDFGSGGLGAGSSMSYRADTDNAVERVSAVPEPASWLMMIFGVGAVGFALRRRVRASEVKFDAKIKRMTEGAVA